MADQSHQNAIHLMNQGNIEEALQILKLNATRFHSIESLIYYVEFAPYNIWFSFFVDTIKLIATTNKHVANILQQSWTNAWNIRIDLKYLSIIESIAKDIRIKFPNITINIREINNSIWFWMLKYTRGWKERECYWLKLSKKDTNWKDVLLHSHLHIWNMLEIPEIQKMAKHTICHEMIHKISEGFYEIPTFLDEWITEQLTVKILRNERWIYLRERWILEKLIELSKYTEDQFFSFHINKKSKWIINILNSHINDLIAIFSKVPEYHFIVKEMIQYRSSIGLIRT